MKTQTIYDPPAGWKYGFPKPFNPLPGEELTDTLIRDGYPQKEIDKLGGLMYCRFWQEEVEDDKEETKNE